MSPMRLGYRDMGIELVSLEEIHSFHPKRPPMAEEKRDKGAKDPIKFLLAEALMQKRNEMLEIFSQILH
jgi:hypothetical protein